MRKPSDLVTAALVAAALLALPARTAVAQPLGTGFTYQGELHNAGVTASGPHDLRFRLYDAVTGGNQIGGVVQQLATTLDAGRFTASLDFGAVFAGQSRWLEIDVRPAGGGAYTTLSPRQLLSAAPVASYAMSIPAQFNTFNANAGNAVFTTGNVGIGTASPAAGLHITRSQGGISLNASDNLFVNDASDFVGVNRSSPITGAEVFGLQNSASQTGYTGMYISSNSVTGLPFYGYRTPAASGWTYLDNTGLWRLSTLGLDRLGIAPSGNVGIGNGAATSAPAYPLHIATSLQFVQQIDSSNASGTWLSLNNTASGRTWNIGSSGSGNGEGPGKLLFRDAAASAVRMTVDTAGNVGIGSVTPEERLEVAGPDATVRVRNTADTGGGFVADTFSTLQLGLYNPSAAIWGVIPASTKRSLFGVQNTGRVGTLTNNAGSPVWRNILDDGFGNGAFTGTLSAAASGSINAALTATHTGTGVTVEAIFGNASTIGSSSAVGVRGEARGDSGTGVYGNAFSTTGQAYGVIGVGSSSNAFSAGVYGESANANGVYGYSFAGKAVFGRSDSGYGLYTQTTNGGAALYGVRTANNNRGWFGGIDEAGSAISNTGNGFVARTTTGTYALYAERNPGGATPNVNRGWFGSLNEGAWAESDQGNGLAAFSRSLSNAAVYCRNDGGGRALFADGVAAVRALDILGGADLAEPFDIAAVDSPEPGMVVVIDPDKPGDLKVAKEAYDSKVAGIISGANGVSPGMVMRDKDKPMVDGKHPVAMTGRVWCFADASTSEIKPGDRLTTSTTPGHAMKAEDAARAPGTVIGKAMTPLTKGEKGLVLVLVNLQ